MDLIPFEERWAEKWDKFVMSDSVNGTFLQTRNFLNYHPLGRFADKSLLFVKGNNIVAVLPANSIFTSGEYLWRFGFGQSI